MDARAEDAARDAEDAFPRHMVRLMTGSANHQYMIPPTRIDAVYQYTHDAETQHQLQVSLERLTLTLRREQLLALAAHAEQITLFQRCLLLLLNMSNELLSSHISTVSLFQYLCATEMIWYSSCCSASQRLHYQSRLHQSRLPFVRSS